MMLSERGKVNFGKNELSALTFLVLLIWLKVYSVDFTIADTLNWPFPGSMDFPLIRSAMRALAVGVPALAAVLCVMVPVSMGPAKHRGWYLLVFDFALSVLVLTDILFVRYYSDIFIFRNLLLLPQAGVISKSIGSLLKPSDILLFADIPVIAMLMLKNKIDINFARVTKGRIAVSGAVLSLSVAIQVLTVWHLAANRPTIVNAMYDRLSVCAWTGIGTFHWVDALSLAGKAFRPDSVPEAEVRTIREWFSKHNAAARAPLAKGRNLILVQCESLQYFVIGLRVNGVELTPNLNRFTRESVYFRNTWNQTAGGLSSDSEFMANTGMFPAPSGAAYTEYDSNDYNSLPRNLRTRGYRTAAFQGTYGPFWNSLIMHHRLGFEKDYSRNTFPNGEIIGLGLSDRTIFSETLKALAHLENPFYAFVVTLSSHHPFDFEGMDDGTLVLPQELKGTLVGSYLVSIHYFDREFGRFIDGLRREKLLDKSLVVVYGDHPAIPAEYREEMGKLLGMKTESPVDWKKTGRIPLMFRMPGKERITGISDIDTGQMDILPTVAGLMGLDIRTVFGKDLFAENQDEPVVFRNGSYIVKGIFVEPSVGRATRIHTGEKMNADDFRPFTDDARQRLYYSDLIIEHNLIREVLQGNPQESRLFVKDTAND
jgi:phosphoglycerol transferase MdoB-like AlkP superfamily enzyme